MDSFFFLYFLNLDNNYVNIFIDNVKQYHINLAPNKLINNFNFHISTVAVRSQTLVGVPVTDWWDESLQYMKDKINLARKKEKSQNIKMF